MKRAVVLLSGGIDSATTLYYALNKGYQVFCLTFDYGQRHKKEIYSAKALTRSAKCRWRLLKVELPWKGSALLDKRIKLPKGKKRRSNIPSTYVPGRNIIFLSYAVSYAETIGADAIFIGANQVDYSGYPDCRLSFIEAFTDAINRGTKAAQKGKRLKIEAPLINKTKKDIIKAALRLKVPLKYTWSCYKGLRKPCARCDACLIREEAFKRIGIQDPAYK
ncbi:MAG: 7-cyano-7-deazaguanine synthase QueC [Candidatus Omnitrophica bacterium]|nr:7-cyano-7-deazaguanine synthase QueC [Candidatus Omnitrophota bacterium]